MYARQVDQRSAIFQKALQVGEAYQLRTKVTHSFNPITDTLDTFTMVDGFPITVCLSFLVCITHSILFFIFVLSASLSLSLPLPPSLPPSLLPPFQALLIRSLLQKHDIRVNVRTVNYSFHSLLCFIFSLSIFMSGL